MSTYLEQNRTVSIEMAIKLLKEEFRKWYSMLSVEELTGNPDLTDGIEAMEKALLAGT